MKRPIKLDENEVEDEEEKKIKYEDEVDSNNLQSKKLGELIRYKKKLSMKKANFILTNENIELSSNNQSELANLSPQFFVQDIQRVLLYSLIGTQYRYFPRWCKILRPKYIKSVNLITIDNLSEYDYQQNKNSFKKFEKLFLDKNQNINSIEFTSPYANGMSFFDELNSVPITRTVWHKIRDSEEFQYKIKKVVDQYKKFYSKAKLSSAASTSILDKIPRTSLLMSVAQMLREDYPLPFDNSGTHDCKDYVLTKEKYAKVTDKSPLYSIDCEMCYNEDGEMEIVWIAIVDENLQCIYESYVKPLKPIKNYLTHITGVSERTLESITTNLFEVQQKIIELLPSDAILCGQSLNNDLHALKMFHPYVIDTSIIYNISGSRDIKPSLRQLSAQFLGKLIQEDKHNPAVDARASLELVLLKLRQSFDFGDVIINGCINMFDQEDHNLINLDDLNSLSDPTKISKFIYQTGLNIQQEFFNVLTDNNISNIYIRNNQIIENSNKHQSQLKNTIEVNNNQEAFEQMTNALNNNKFTWCKFYSNAGDDLNDENKKIYKYIKNIKKKLADDSLLMVAFTGRKNLKDNENELDEKDLFLKGRCFLVYKCDEMEKLEKEIKELYDIVKTKPNEGL